MRCEICSITEEETDLYDGISENRIIKICKKCSEEEEIPLIKKPSQNQIEESQRSPSVRERMEKISGLRKSKAGYISKDQEIATKNLAKLKIPPQKQHHPELIDNYFWKIQMKRREKKLTLSQLAEKTNLSEQDVKNLESGVLPEEAVKNSQKLAEFIKPIENILGVKLMKQQLQNIIFSSSLSDSEKEQKKEHEVLKEVEQKMKMSDNPASSEEKEDETSEHNKINDNNSGKNRNNKIQQIEKGDFDFSKRENLKDISLKDLQDMHYRKKQKEKEMKRKQEHQDMFGRDVDIDE